MNEHVHDTLMLILSAAGLPADSSAELAFHVALHYPDHGAALLTAITPEPPEIPGVLP